MKTGLSAKLLRPIMVLVLLIPLSLSGQVSKLIVVDQLVTERLNEIKGLFLNERILILPEKGNPLAIITDELKGNTYSELHIFALTKPGSIVFDEVTILAENVNDYSDQFRQWKDFSGKTEKIIIHSDVLTSVPEGRVIIENIARITGKKVVVE